VVRRPGAVLDARHRARGRDFLGRRRRLNSGGDGRRRGASFIRRTPLHLVSKTKFNIGYDDWAIDYLLKQA
jgi:hypothetical protein